MLDIKFSPHQNINKLTVRTINEIGRHFFTG